MNTLRLAISAVCLAIATGGAIAYARAAEPAAAPAAAQWHGHHGAAGSFRHVLRQLNLTPEQKTQIQAIVAQAKPQLDATRASARENHLALAAAAPTDARYPELVATEQSNAVARIQRMSDLKTQIYAVLTPEQQAKIPGILAAERAARAARIAAWRAQHTQS